MSEKSFFDELMDWALENKSDACEFFLLWQNYSNRTEKSQIIQDLDRKISDTEHPEKKEQLKKLLDYAITQ